jgi:D-galactarolactone cycloisomerase
MIITKVRGIAIEAAFPRPFAYLRTWFDRRTTILIKIETDNGLTGWGGCCAPVSVAADAIKSITPLLIGQDPLQTAHLRQAIATQLGDAAGVGEAVTGVFVALWEIKDRHHLLSITPNARIARLTPQSSSAGAQDSAAL